MRVFPIIHNLPCWTVLVLAWTMGWVQAAHASETQETQQETLAVQDALVFGRIFFSPNQRQRLDQLRLDSAAGIIPVQQETTEGDTIITGPRYVWVSGMILKEKGDNVFWLNGQSLITQDRFDGEGFSAFPNRMDARGLPVSPVDSARMFHLKSGQTLDLVEKRVRNTYEIDPHALVTARREPVLPEGGATTGSMPEAQRAERAPEEAHPFTAQRTAEGSDEKRERTLGKLSQMIEAVRMAEDVAKMVDDVFAFAEREGEANRPPAQRK